MKLEKYLPQSQPYWILVKSESPHIPVLLNETLAAFKTLDEGAFLDATLGYGGHSQAILDAHPHLKLIGCDRDIEALTFSKQRLSAYSDRTSYVQSEFARVFEHIASDTIVGILADIGVSSLQLDKKERGFSFESDTLDMRMDYSQEFSAYDVVNGYSEAKLEELIRVFGEERFSKKIASLIVTYRKQHKFTSAKQLADLIASHVRTFKIHPATLTFQAIRIEVNDELGQLRKFLSAVEKEIQHEAILAIISFHSLEDRIVKNAFKEWSRSCICPPEAYKCECGGHNERGEMLSKKPIVATAQEIKQNPRSRSAKLRLFRFKAKND